MSRFLCGSGGIRTLDTGLPYARFRVVCLQPAQPRFRKNTDAILALIVFCFHWYRMLPVAEAVQLLKQQTTTSREVVVCCFADVIPRGIEPRFTP